MFRFGGRPVQKRYSRLLWIRPVLWLPMSSNCSNQLAGWVRKRSAGHVLSRDMDGLDAAVVVILVLAFLSVHYCSRHRRQ
jgi:hypothetical protein